MSSSLAALQPEPTSRIFSANMVYVTPRRRSTFSRHVSILGDSLTTRSRVSRASPPSRLRAMQCPMQSSVYPVDLTQRALVTAPFLYTNDSLRASACRASNARHPSASLQSERAERNTIVPPPTSTPTPNLGALNRCPDRTGQGTARDIHPRSSGAGMEPGTGSFVAYTHPFNCDEIG